eukprot:scaffold9257_cov171-Skeletonema_marinoi.AAC.2
MGGGGWYYVPKYEGSMKKKKKGDAPIFSDGNGSACLIVTKDDIDEKLLHTFFLSMVWSPAGGWWPTPVAWKRNTTICAFSICVISSLIFKISAEKERRPIAPFKHIPSQRWCKHAKEDDPSLP